MRCEAKQQLLNKASQCIACGDLEAAVSAYEELIQAGEISLSVSVGCLFRDGDDRIPANAKLAEHFFRKGADQKYEAAQFYLARYYYDIKKYDDAFHWFSEAAKEHSARSKYWIYVLFKKKLIPDLCEERAIGNLEQAASCNHWYAKRDLACLFIKGKFGILNIFKGLFIYFKLITYNLKLLLDKENSHLNT